MYEKKNTSRIFVIGFIGSDRYNTAQKIAIKKGFSHVDMDYMIQNKTNQSIIDLCRFYGEHEYRNKEYEALMFLAKERKIVVSCGDGIVLDKMCRDILKRNTVIFVDDDPKILFENAKNDNSLPYSFLTIDDEATQYKKFCALYEIRKELYNQCVI